MNLLEILKDVPEGTELYSPAYGRCSFYCIAADGRDRPILITSIPDSFPLALNPDGSIRKEGECMLFPSKDQRDWTKFKGLCQFKDGDAVWVRDYETEPWMCLYATGELFLGSTMCYSEQRKAGESAHYRYCVPYEPRPF